MYFKFRGIDSRDMGVTVLTRPNIISPEMRTWTTFIDGKDGAYSHPMGLKPNSFSFTIAVEDVENIDKVLGWLTGRGRFIRSDLPNRYLNVHINEGVRLHRTVEWLYQGEVTVQVVDPFWYSIKDEWQEYKPNLIKNGWKSFSLFGYEGKETQAPLDVFEEGYGRNLIPDSERGILQHSNHGTDYPIEVDNTREEYIRVRRVFTDNSHKSTLSCFTSDFYISDREVEGDSHMLSVEVFPEKYDMRVGLSINNLQTAKAGQWTRVAIERKYPKGVRTRISGISGVMTEDKQQWVRIRRYKLEEGTNVTEWTPAWEDLDIADKPVRAWDNVYYYREDIGEGKTRIRYVGGKHKLKMLASMGNPKKGEMRSNTFHLYSSKYPIILHNQMELVKKEPFEGEEIVDINFRSPGSLNFQMRLETDDPKGRIDVVVGEPFSVEGPGGILKNEGNYPSKPIIKLVKGEGKSVTIKTKDSYLTYTFPNRETEVEIDTTTKTATYNGETRDRFIETDAVEIEFPPGPIDIQVEGGTAYFKKKDRWI